MCVCVCVCVGECLPACPCMCDEGSELVFPSITCPGPPNLYRVGVQQSLCSGGTQGRDSLGGLAPRWGWRVAAPTTPGLGGARSLGAAPRSVYPSTDLPATARACTYPVPCDLSSATLPGAPSPPEVGEGLPEALLFQAQTTGPHSQALQDPGRWGSSSDCFHVLPAPSGVGKLFQPQAPCHGCPVGPHFFPTSSPITSGVGGHA